MSEIEVFQFPVTGQQVRSVLLEGEPWFVAADVTAVLGYGGGARNAVARLPERMKGVAEVNTPGGVQRMTVVSESGVYRLVLRSNLPSAEAFQDWLAEEVVPAVRRSGRYEIADKPMSELEMAHRYLAALQREQVLQAELETAAPKARSWDVLADGSGDYSVADAAKVLSRDPAIKLGRDRLFTVLANYGWAFRQKGDGRWRAYQKTAIDTGRLSELATSHYHPRTGELIIDPPQVRVTTKGLHELHRRMGGTAPLHVQPELEEASR